MKVVCAWCQRELGEKPPYDDPAISHGICEPCSKGLEKEMSQRKVLTHRGALEAAEALVEHEREGIAKEDPARRFYKGSSESEPDRTARQRKARSLRASGRFREFEYFSPGGVMEKAEQKKRAKNNPADYRTYDVVKGTRREPRILTKLIGKNFYIIQKEARAWRVLKKTNLRPDALSEGEFITLPEAIDFIERQPKENPLAIYGLANPGRKHGKFRRCVKKVRTSLRKYGRSGSPERICGAALNPPGEVHTKIAGVVYNRCLEIRAEKTGYRKGLYKHPFAQKSGVQILALDNGDLLIHSTRGVRLWKRA